MKAGQDPRKDQSNDGPDYPDNAPNKTHTPQGGSPSEQGLPDAGKPGTGSHPTVPGPSSTPKQ